MSTPRRIRLRTALRRSGFDVVQKRPQLADLLRARGVGIVLDVGGNVGQFGRELRAWGYAGHIVSFEPIPEAAAALRSVSAGDARWEVAEYALGAEAGTATFHVSERTVFSSLRAPLERAHVFDATARTVRDIQVEVRRLDAVFDQYVEPDARAFLKVDTQGSETDVLDGASGVWERIEGVQLELGVEPMYEGETLAPALISRLADAGFRLAQVHPVIFDPSDGMASALQFDAVFARSVA